LSLKSIIHWPSHCFSEQDKSTTQKYLKRNKQPKSNFIAEQLKPLLISDLINLILEYDDSPLVTLKRLDYNRIMPTSVLTILKSIQDHAPIDASIVAALKEALKDETTLDLSGQHIDDHHLITLAEALKGNTTLKSLNLGGIGSEHLKKLFDFLKENKTLTHLSLEGSYLSEDALKSLSCALKENDMLTSLNLNRTNLVNGPGIYVSISPLVLAMETNHSLITLFGLEDEFDDNQTRVSNDDRAKFKAYLQRNRDTAEAAIVVIKEKFPTGVSDIVLGYTGLSSSPKKQNIEAPSKPSASLLSRFLEILRRIGKALQKLFNKVFASKIAKSTQSNQPSQTPPGQTAPIPPTPIAPKPALDKGKSKDKTRSIGRLFKK
jgi:hypothetical protein